MNNVDDLIDYIAHEFHRNSEGSLKSISSIHGIFEKAKELKVNMEAQKMIAEQFLMRRGKSVFLGQYDPNNLQQPSLLKEVPSITTNSTDVKADDEWVKIEDRLPKFYKGVRVLTIGDFTGYRIITCELVQNFREITHWRPLPHPPKGEEC